MPNPTQPSKKSKRPESAGGKKIMGLPSNLVWGGGAFVVIVGIWLIIQLAGGGTPPAPPPAPEPTPVVTEPSKPTEDSLPTLDPLGAPIKPLERKVSMPRTEFETQTKVYELSELRGQPSLAYQIRIPTSWQEISAADLQQQQLVGGLSGVLAYYVSPPDLNLTSSVKIKAEPLGYIQTAASWLRTYAAQNSYTYQAFAEHAPNRAEAEFLLIDRDITYVVRMVAITNGAWVVTAEYSVPVDKYTQERDLQIWTTTDFFLKYIDDRLPESIKTYSALPDIDLLYPTTWVTQAADLSAPNQSYTAFVLADQPAPNQSAQVRGRIDIAVFNADSPSSNEMKLAFLDKKLEIAGIKRGTATAHMPPPPLPDGFTVVSAKTYDLVSTNGLTRPDQYWLIHLKAAQADLYVGLLSPPAQSNYAVWARNYNAVRFIIGHITMPGLAPAAPPQKTGTP